MFKPVIILYLGAVLIAVALVGAGATLLGEEEQLAPTGKTAKVGKKRSVKPVVQKPQPKERDLAAEEAELTRILLAQIKETQDVVDEAWLTSFCRYIQDEAALEGYLNAVLETGARRDQSYKEERRRAKQMPLGDPRFFIELAKQQLYGREVNRRGMDKAHEFLALGYDRAYHADEEHKGVADDFAFSFLKEMIKLQELYRTFAIEVGDEDPRWLEEVIKAREAAIIDRFYRIKHRHVKARKEFKESGNSAALVLKQTDIWRKTVHENLLALGRVYADLAANEVLYKSRQQEYTQRAFKSLAMVYQVSYSGEALKMLRQVNKIERFNLWQMARANWKKAQVAADNGRVQEADTLYFKAVHHYLQCLARSEGQQRETLVEEYRRLKRDIAAWNANKKDAIPQSKNMGPLPPAQIGDLAPAVTAQG